MYSRKTLILAAVVAAGPVAMPASAKNAPNVLASWQGVGLPALAGLWWRWSMSIPAASNPLMASDADSATYCAVGQSGDVWFIGGTFQGVSGTVAHRSCKVPAGMPIFLPAINTVCWPSSGDPPTRKGLEACAKSGADGFTDAYVTVDGQKVPAVRAGSKTLFSIQVPPGDVFGYYGKTPWPSAAWADGYWALIPPLSVGTHTLTFGGKAPAFNFQQDIDYTVTVIKPPLK